MRVVAILAEAIELGYFTIHFNEGYGYDGSASVELMIFAIPPGFILQLITSSREDLSCAPSYFLYLILPLKSLKNEDRLLSNVDAALTEKVP